MNIVEQLHLQETIQNPQTESERLLSERITELEKRIQGVDETLSLEFDKTEGVYHDLEDAPEDLLKVRDCLAGIMPLCKELETEWAGKPGFEEPDRLKEPLFYLAWEIAGLEQDDECLANSALTLAAVSMEKHNAALDLRNP